MWSSLVIILSVVLEEKILEKVYDDDDADGRQMIAIAHWDLRNVFVTQVKGVVYLDNI